MLYTDKLKAAKPTGETVDRSMDMGGGNSEEEPKNDQCMSGLKLQYAAWEPSLCESGGIKGVQHVWSCKIHLCLAVSPISRD